MLFSKNIKTHSSDPTKPNTDFRAASSWSYTYDAQGNKRKTYAYDEEPAAETPSSHQHKRPNSSSSSGYRGSTTSYGSSTAQQGFHSTAYGRYQYDSDKDAVWKFILGTFGVVSALSLVTAGVQLRQTESQGKRYANTAHGGSYMGM